MTVCVPLVNACLTCPDRQTRPEFLDVYRAQRECTAVLIATAEQLGQTQTRWLMTFCSRPITVSRRHRYFAGVPACRAFVVSRPPARRSYAYWHCGRTNQVRGCDEPYGGRS